MTHTLDELAQLFDFTLDDLEHNRRGMMSLRQRRKLTPSNLRFLTTQRLLTSIIVLVLVPVVVAIGLTSPAFTNPQPLFTIMIVIALIGLLINSYLVRRMWRYHFGDARAIRADIAENAAASFIAQPAEDADGVYLESAHTAEPVVIMHDNLVALDSETVYIVYHTPRSHILLSLEPA
ncbi:MAG: hypothetical protein D6737_11270 [Chloroflexi bacterium]|nr:MAG: hypothetical protein D6737_11270 [Chloroflexota bacterium]